MPKNKTVYSFEELSEEVRERLVEEYRKDDNLDYEWWDFVIEDFCTICETMGIDIDYDVRQVRCSGKDKNGKPFPERQIKTPKVFFSGFCSQGDGSGFYCGVEIFKMIPALKYRKWRKHAPEEKLAFTKFTTHKKILELINQGDIDFRYRTTCENRYYHLNHDCTRDLDTEDESIKFMAPWVDEQLKDLEEAIHDQLEGMNKWLYRRLEAEYDYLTSEECAIEHLSENYYDEDGEEVTKPTNKLTQAA